MAVSAAVTTKSFPYKKNIHSINDDFTTRGTLLTQIKEITVLYFNIEGRFHVCTLGFLVWEHSSKWGGSTVVP